jgi:predicted Zn-dependent protease
LTYLFRLEWGIYIVGGLLTLWLGTVGNVTCLLQPAHVPTDPAQLRGSGTVSFVPLDDFPRRILEAFVEHYRQKYGLKVRIEAAVAVPPVAFDPARKQLIAEEVLAAVRRAHGSSGRVLIALSERDLYARSLHWRYAFSYRQVDAAVVSSARMDHPILGFWPPAPERQVARLRKMVTKSIGVLYYNLPLSENCRSVMYGHVGGPHELDFMGEDF